MRRARAGRDRGPRARDQAAAEAAPADRPAAVAVRDDRVHGGWPLPAVRRLTSVDGRRASRPAARRTNYLQLLWQLLQSQLIKLPSCATIRISMRLAKYEVLI